MSDPQQRQNFYFYNNGITVTCSKFRHNDLQRSNWQVRLEGLQIINGGQTSKTIHDVVSRNPEAGTAQIHIRIYELPEDDADLVLNITQATNSQNQVDLRDLRSNDDRQRRLGHAIDGLGYRYRRQRGGDSPTGPNLTYLLTSATVAEAVLAVWRTRPHQARFMAAEHFGSLYDLIFTPDLNGAQAIVAALLLRQAETRRRRPPEGAPEFLSYGSRFIAMLMGRYLLDAMGVPLERLDHRNFATAETLIADKADAWFKKAVDQIAAALGILLGSQERTLQRLSAQFRRADLVRQLLGQPLTARDGVSGG